MILSYLKMISIPLIIDFLLFLSPSSLSLSLPLPLSPSLPLPFSPSPPPSLPLLRLSTMQTNATALDKFLRRKGRKWYIPCTYMYMSVWMCLKCVDREF